MCSKWSAQFAAISLRENTMEYLPARGASRSSSVASVGTSATLVVHRGTAL